MIYSNCFFRYRLHSDYGYIRHFRKCRNSGDCDKQRVVDYEVANWSEAFSENVKKVRRIVFGR